MTSRANAAKVVITAEGQRSSDLINAKVLNTLVSMNSIELVTSIFVFSAGGGEG